MEKIKLLLKNCYGIGKLEYDFDYSKTNTFLVYAPNGTMKTSLAKTLRYFSNESASAPRDQVYPERESQFELSFDDVEITPRDERILVIDPDANNYDASSSISNFIASKELKEAYDGIYEDLEKQKSAFIKKLKGTSQSTDCESEIVTTFRQHDRDNFYDILDRVATLLTSEQPKYNFRYNDIFDKKGAVKKFLEKHQDAMDTYVQKYDSLISESRFFKKSNNTFGTYQANAVVKSVEDNSFFDAGHSLTISGEIQIKSASELNQLVDEEINKIISDKDLQAIFNKIDKDIGANADLRAFKAAIEKNNLLLVELKNYDEFKKKAWLGFLYELKSDALELHAFYMEKKEALVELSERAKEELGIWKELIDLYNNRFHVPFKVELANQEDVILKKELAVLNFSYSDREGQAPTKHEKELLFNNVLSRGERRAFYILQILFAIEAKKTLGNTTFIVFDDIADSFDYKNKYAIIEYIKDLVESGIFKLLILTHNFDFYRTVASRLKLPRNTDINAVIMALRNNDGTVTFSRGEYVNDIFQYFLGRIAQKKIFVSLIPFLRNIIEHTEGSDSTEYDTLTACLHKKVNSEQILVSDIVNLWNAKFPKYIPKLQTINFRNERIIDVIYSVADEIIGSPITNEIPLENKIVLAIATRLKAEEFMISKIANLNLGEINDNQTQELFKLYKVAATNKSIVKTLDKVNLMTPENIHLNAFMYEPLIDVGLRHLIQLHSDVKALN